MTACEGLARCGETGVSTTLNAVRELYAGKLARTVPRGPRFREGTRLPSVVTVVVTARAVHGHYRAVELNHCGRRYQDEEAEHNVNPPASSGMTHRVTVPSNNTHI